MKILARANKKLRGNGKFYAIPEPTKSWFYVTEYDSNGYPIKAKTIGCSGEMPIDYMYGFYNDSYKNIMRYINNFEFNEGITSIRKGAFYRNTGLKSITIPDSVTSIGDEAFRYCTWLTNITIPQNVTKIGTCALQSMSQLLSITILAKTPPISTSDIFAGCNKLKTIYIPKGTLDAYSTATNWSLYASKFVELSE